MLLASHAPLAGGLLLALPVLWPGTYPGDHFTFWAAGHIVAIGRSPYDARAWTDGAIDAAAASGLVVDMRPIIAKCCAVLWTYPPWTAVALAPFGALPVSIGVPLFHLTSLAAAVVAAVGLARSVAWRDVRSYGLSLLLFALFEPFIVGVRGGHFVGVLLAGVCLVQLGLLRDRAWPLVAGAVLLSLKPHPAIGLAVVALGVLLIRRRWSHLAWIAAALGAIAIPSVLAYPDSVGAIVAGSAERAADQGATTWTALAAIFGSAPAIVVAAAQLALVGIGVASVRLAPRGFRIHAAVAAGLAAGLAVVPYIQDHDQLLVVPALVLTVCYADLASRGRRWLFAIAWVAFVIGPWLIALPVLIAGTPTAAGVVPFLAGAALLAGAVVLRASRRNDAAADEEEDRLAAALLRS